ncbi:M15 family metallopeptidase [Gallibacterium trehalosifermentans]|uniref:M15 family metallopeptidase n=1 Tax=Gallibacterium trehalosifermentans TaxID=516935 RepID=A0ABV6H184_9PAST
MLSVDCLTGKSRQHLSPLPSNHSTAHFLQKEAVKAFLALQQAAKKAGIDLQPASSFRDFGRQQWIWNHKFNGIRKVHDDQGNLINITLFSEWQKCEAILRWSTLPGASRHHWGTEIDVFAPNLLPIGQSLLLEPQEYQHDGYFTPLVEFLVENIEHYGFSLPFVNLPSNKKIGIEYWHLSYSPLADIAKQQFTPEILLNAWKDENIAGKETLLQRLPEIFEYFMV